MKEETRCQVCGASLVSEAPDGLCPACLFGVGLDGDGADELDEVEMVAEKNGDMVGRYLLMEKIGEGGFGVVFRAEQQTPVKRIVAVKIIKPGMDSKEVVNRFQMERQALALMEHPSIARVYDAGTTERGRPYFVMELVEGLPLTVYCDEAALGMRERLKLFAQVCRAVQHAHQKGVIHRDLKPSNILVRTSGDGTPVPKIIDFGVAKAISIELTEKTFFTMFGRMVGTPRYMSPEQTELNAVDVDTRSDIYALGIVLYELVTGRPPLSERELSTASFDEMRRMIREDDALKPSARVMVMPEDERNAAAKERGIDPFRFSRCLRGDLDWIVMKALAKERSRRYDTAHEFAVDVRRYLRNLPVIAGPPGPSYRIGKFVRRHRAGVIVSTLAVIALVAEVIRVRQDYFQMSDEKDKVEFEKNEKEDEKNRTEHESLKLLVEGVRTGRASDQGSKGKALRALGEVGRSVLGELGLTDDEVRELRADARNELIACLDWTDLEKRVLSDGLKGAWVPAALDATHKRWVFFDPDDGLVVREEKGMISARPCPGSPVLRPLRFSPDGNLVAAGFGTADRWDLVVWNWKENHDVVTEVQGVHAAFDFHPKGGAFAVGKQEKTIEVFNEDGVLLHEPLRLRGIPRTVRFSPGDGKLLAVGTKEAGVEVYDVVSGGRVQEWPGVDAVSLAWAPDRPALAVGEMGGSVTVWELGSPRPVFSAPAHGFMVEWIAWSSDGCLLASGCPEEISLWDGRQGELLCEYTAWGRSLCFSDDDRSLGPVLTGSQTLSVLDVKRAESVCHRAAGHSGGKIVAALWLAEGQVLATAADDGLRLWNCEGRQLRYLPDHQVALDGMVASETHLYLSTPEGIVRHAVDTPNQRLHCGAVEEVAKLMHCGQIVLTPDGKTLAVARDKEVVLLDLPLGTVRQRIAAPESTAFLAISPDGNWLAAGTRDGTTVRTWRLRPNVEEVEDLKVAGAATVAFFPRSEELGSAKPVPPLLMTGDAMSYRLWKWIEEEGCWAQEADHPSRMANPDGRMARTVFSTRGTVAVVAFERKLLRALNARTLDLMTQPGFDKQWPLTIDPAGRLMVTEADNSRLFIWNLEKVMVQLKEYNLDWNEEGVTLPGFKSKPPTVVQP